MRYPPRYVSHSLFTVTNTWIRCSSNASALATSELKSPSFKDTLLLPNTSFPLRSDRFKSELRFRNKTCIELYQWQWANSDRPLFVLHDGPPYANGRLHMGHALNKILKDIINRYNVLIGKRVHYAPGWDCHGLPIEHNALEQLGSDPQSLPTSLIRSTAMDFANKEVQVQKEEFFQLGIMADWNSHQSTYRTLDHEYEMRQLSVFKKMLEKGLIYRHHRPVHYSPSSRSALAEAELVYHDNHISHSVYISFPLCFQNEDTDTPWKTLVAEGQSVNVLVWTTTPWTLTANMGIAVHNKVKYSMLKLTNRPGYTIVATERLSALERVLGPFESVAEIAGSDLVGISYKSPFATGGIFKIIFSPHVTIDSGTGLVHCAPAHGMEDYKAFQSLGLDQLDLLCHVDGEGKFTQDVASVTGETIAKSLVGLDVLTDGSKAMVKLMEDNGALLKVQRIKHRYPYDWKTGQPVIIIATSQWFANLDDIKTRALQAIESVDFYPAISRNRLESFVRSRSEWCISRQRAWGVPILALHHIVTDHAVLDSCTLEHILSVLETKGIKYWWDGPVEEFVPPHLLEEGIEASATWRKGTDTMDVWFDSGSSWSMLEGLTSDARDTLADVCVEGSDQHRGWFQSQLFTSVGYSGESKAPYGALITHGMVLDQTGKKMSKSVGNIIRPATIINGGEDQMKDPAYGADVLRMWAASVEYGSDSPIGPVVLAQCMESLRKLRNSARFILGNINGKQSWSDTESLSQKEMGLAERYMMHELYKLEQTALESYRAYNFSRAMTALTNFANVTLSSFYFDITKDCLYADSIRGLQRKSVVKVLEKVLRTMTSIMAPVVPHLAEEIYHHYSGGGDDISKYPSIFTTPWRPLDSIWRDLDAEQDMVELLRLRGFVLSLLEKARTAKELRSSLEAEVDLVLPNEIVESKFVDLLRREENFLKTLFIVSNVIITDEGSLGTSAPDWLYSETVSIPGTTDLDLYIRVRPAALARCPRCWMYNRKKDEALCSRCKSVLHE